MVRRVDKKYVSKYLNIHLIRVLVKVEAYNADTNYTFSTRVLVILFINHSVVLYEFTFHRFGFLILYLWLRYVCFAFLMFIALTKYVHNLTLKLHKQRKSAYLLSVENLERTLLSVLLSSLRNTNMRSKISSYVSISYICNVKNISYILCVLMQCVMIDFAVD